MLKTRQISNPQILAQDQPAADQPQIKAKGKAKGKAAQTASAQAPMSLKEQMAEKRKRDRVRKEFTTFATTAGCFGLVVGVLLGLVGGIKIAAAGTVGILVLAIACKYPRLAMWGFLIYVPFGGTITYAIGNSPLLQLAKDGLYIPALMGVFQHCKRERYPS
ncbi:MAG: hypothetical protein HC772_11455 [Leptolyngbyaceae cyanobacterium CRU_2_3]|nr:hypothetical protein [Leptolyngbyaceae cyanobacterium CRU_2_3]